MQDKFVQARQKKEAYRGGMSTDDNADCANLDKSNAQVINGQFLSANRISCWVLSLFFAPKDYCDF